MDELTINAKSKMQKSLESLQSSLAKIRTGRAHAGILDHITVDYYGTPTQLNQVAIINVADATSLIVQPYEKNMKAVIEKTIRDSDLGLNPAASGDNIRIPMPSLTEERRRELSRVAGQYAESARVAVRNIRRDGMDQIKKAKADGMSEDDQKFWEEAVQELTDNTIKMLDETLESKQAEIMQV